MPKNGSVPPIAAPMRWFYGPRGWHQATVTVRPNEEYELASSPEEAEAIIARQGYPLLLTPEQFAETQRDPTRVEVYRQQQYEGGEGRQPGEWRLPEAAGDGRPDPGYEGDIGKARRAVEARGLRSGQEGYWTAVFGELRPDLVNRRPPPGRRLIPLRQYLAQAMRGQGAPGAMAGHRPGNWGAAPETEGPESYNDMTRRWKIGTPSVREDQIPLPNWHPGYVGPSDQSIIKLDPLRPPGEFPMPRPSGETVNPPLPLGVGAPTVPSLASIRPEQLAALLRQAPQA